MEKSNKLKSRQDELDRIQNLDELINFAIKNSDVHREFFHYTTIDGLLGIIENKLLRLSVGKHMNDMQEITKGNSEVWDRTFISSFSYGDNENIAMWSIYSLPWENGIRISIPGLILKKWIYETNEIFSLDERNQIIEKIDFKSIHLTDVLYSTYDKKDQTEKIKIDSYRIINTQSQLKHPNPSIEKIVTGFIKNKAWEYENETRVRIETLSNLNVRKIAIKIPDYVINSFEITTSPWFKNYSKLNYLNNKLNVNESIFKELVRLKTICESCEFKYKEVTD